MSIAMNGLVAYNKALADFQSTQQNIAKSSVDLERKIPTDQKSFSETLTDSLKEVNRLQEEKNTMITSFASGETQNVHELMISMQKASVAMNLTSAVRNKIIEAYKEISRIQF